MAFSFLEGEYCSSANDSVSPPVGERHSFFWLDVTGIAHLPRRTRGPYDAYPSLSGFQRAHCTYQEFQRAEAALDILRVGGAAIREYEAFIEQGEALNPLPAPVNQALGEARTRIEEIRERMRTGG